MQMLDIRTIAIIFLVNSLVATLFMAALWQQSRKQFPGITLWLTSFALLTVAFALISLRNIIPDAASILIANTCVAAAAFILYLGLERFVACPSSQRHNYIILAAFVGLFTYFTFFQPDVAIRIVLLNITLLLMLLQSSWLLLQRVCSQLKPLSRATGILCLLFALAACYRLILVAFMPASSDYLNVNPWDAIGLIINQILTIGLVLALILMVNRRMSLHILNQEEILVRSKVELEISNRDLTELKQAEEALQESEAQYRLLAEHTTDTVWLMDMNLKITYHSPSAEKLRGFTAQEIVELPLEQHVTPESLKLVSTVFLEELPRVEADPEYNPVRTVDVELYCKDGATVWRECKLSVIRDPSGKPVSFLGEARDITERKQIEEALREAESRYRALFDRSLELIYLHDLEGNFIEANQAALDLFGYQKEDITSLNFLSLLSEDQLPLAIKAGQEIRHIGYRTKIDEYRLKRNDGEYIYLETRGTAIKKEGKAIAILGIARDITERKQAQESLFESEQNYRLLARYNKQLNDIAISFSKSSDMKELFSRIAASFRLLTGSIAATFSVYDQLNRDLKAVSLSIDPVHIDKINSVFGPGLFEMRMPVSEDDMAQMLSQPVRRPEDLYELSMHVIPRDISAAIMDAIGCRQIVALAISHIGEVIGTCVAYLQENQPIVPDDALKTYSQMAGLVIKRRQDEVALLESEEKYRTIFKNAAEGIFQSTLEGKYISVNPAFARIAGFNSPDEMIDTVTDIQRKLYVHPEDRIRLMDLLERHGTISNFEVEIKRKDGILIWISINVKLVEDGTGKTKYLEGTIIDITMRKLAEGALQESEEQFRNSLENAPDCIYMNDLEGNFLYGNRRCEEITGYKREELIGKNFVELNILTENSLARATELLRANRKGKSTGPDELGIIRKDGRLVPVEINSSVLHRKGQAVVLAFARDINERRQAEEELEKSHQELRSLSAHLISLREEERTLLAREMHDELGQALTALKMDLTWLSNKLPEGQVPLAEKTASMLKLVNSTVTAVKRISTGLRPGLLDDLGLVAAMEWQAGEFQARTGIKTGLVFKPDDIMVDNERATALFRIFQEVLTNVARHAAATRIDAYLREKDGALELSVRDNGKGIEQKMVDGSKSLGLIGMRERCHHLGGTVDIRGKSGKGTTVTINLPAREMKQ